MIDFFKTASGSYNYVLIVSIVAWIVSTFGVLAGLHKHRTDTLSAIQARPKPMPERLRTLLERIDSKILPALKSGRKGFEGGITASQFQALQTLAAEPGANALIQISPDVKMGVGMGPEGIIYGVTFTLTDAVLK